MGLMSMRREAVTATHLPTGTTARVEVNNASLRSMHQQKEAALALLWAKLFVLQHPERVGVAEHEYVYNLPDDVPYPRDLAEYKSLRY